MSDTKAITADQIIAAIERGFDARGKDEWDAPEFEEARCLTAQAGCVWDFEGWRETLAHLKLSEWPRRLGGVTLDETCAHCDAPWEVECSGKRYCHACATQLRSPRVSISSVWAGDQTHRPDRWGIAEYRRPSGQVWFVGLGVAL